MTANPSTLEALKRVKAECDAAGTPYPWANTKPFAAVDGAGYTLRIGGDCRMDGLSDHPMSRHQCPKCGYTLTTNEAPQAWECPIDGEALGPIAYP